jgi:hypothetical protein
MVAISATRHEGEAKVCTVCTVCGHSIPSGVGRFNVGDCRYHVECFDPRKHVSQARPPEHPVRTVAA